MSAVDTNKKSEMTKKSTLFDIECVLELLRRTRGESGELMLETACREQFSFYGAYHTNTVNVNIHILCVPVCVLCLSWETRDVKGLTSDRRQHLLVSRSCVSGPPKTFFFSHFLRAGLQPLCSTWPGQKHSLPSLGKLVTLRVRSTFRSLRASQASSLTS